MGAIRNLVLSATATTVLFAAFAPSGASADVRTDARRAFRRGMALIAEGQADEGIEQLLEAYEILPHPNVLYNIARAYTDMGRYEDAREYFERYLDSDPADREEVQRFIAALDARLAEREAGAAVAAAPGETGEAEHAAPPPEVASVEDVQALEDAATQIAALAEATQSESLARRAEQLRALAEALEARSASTTTAGTSAETAATSSASGEDGALAAGPTGELGGGLELREASEAVYEESVVSAARYAQSPLDAPASTTIITRQDVRLSGLMFIPELFRRTAGVEVMTTTPIDSNISIRGFNQRLANRMLVLVDGRSTYIDTLGATLWATLPLSTLDIERVEIIRGPASALYGANSFAGIINIITRPPGPAETEAMVGFGNGGQLTGVAYTSGYLGPIAYRISAGYLRAQRFSLEVSPERVDYYAPTTFGDPSLGVDGYWGNASLRYRIIPEVVANLQGGFAERQQNFQGTGPLRDFVARGPVGHVLGSIETPYGTVRAFYTHIDAQAEIGTVPTGTPSLLNNFESGTLDIEAEFAQEFDLLVHHNFHLGASYRRKTIAWDYLGRDYEQNHFAVFTQEAMRITEWLSLVGSLRMDVHPLLNDPVFSPRGAVIVHPTARSSLRASVGTAFRTPTFLESYLDLDNPTPVPAVHVRALGSEVTGRRLSPESIFSVELGFRDEDSDFFDFEINAYYNRVTGLISFGQIDPYRAADTACPSHPCEGGYSASGSLPLGTIGFQNEGTEFDVFGGEAMTRIYPVTGLDIYANYAINYTLTTVPQGAIGLRTSEARTSAHRLNLGIQYRSEFGLDISADIHYASEQVWLEQVFDVEQGVVYQEFPLPQYYMLNARIGYRLFDDALEVGIVGYNITDHRHRQHPFGQLLSARFLVTLAFRI